MYLQQLETPSAVLDLPRVQRNIQRMQQHMNRLGVKFRPHAKTSKCIEVVLAQLAGGAQGMFSLRFMPAVAGAIADSFLTVALY